MSLKSIPVDASRMQFVAIDLEEVPDFGPDGARTGRQRTDADGRLVFRINALCLIEGESGGQTVSVRVAVENDPPVIVPLAPVNFTDLQARPWEQGDRHGISLVASGVEPAINANGRARKADPLAEQAAA